MSSSSIEGMIKFGMASLRGAGTDKSLKRFQSPRDANATSLSRSKSPDGTERDQIASIIDEITNQMRAAKKLNLRRPLTKIDELASFQTDYY